jgi:hypothetical protein
LKVRESAKVEFAIRNVSIRFLILFCGCVEEQSASRKGDKLRRVLVEAIEVRD